MTHCRRALRGALIAVLTAILILPLTSQAEPATAADTSAQTIRVGLAWAKQELTVADGAGLSLIDEQTGAVVVESATSLTFATSGDGIMVTNYGRCSGAVRIEPAPDSGDYLSYAGRHYRGSFRIVNEAGTLTLINVLPLEEYLYGVLPKEIGSDWPIEAQKAQAVAARTYALASTGKYSSYDVRPTTDSQVYGGLDSEKPLSNEAVDETAGLVATYNGQLIATYFYSSSGGYTESNENVWTGGTPQPYLRSVPDPYDSVGPWNAWHRELTLDQIGQSLKAAGYDLGTLYAVVPEEKVKSGRWVYVTVRGSKGSQRLTSNAFRIAIGTSTLPSTLFTMVAHDAGLANVEQAYDAAATVGVVGADGQVVAASLNGATVIGAGGTSTLGAAGESGFTVIGKQPVPAGLTFDGSGWGHGIGMSQWGTYGMAQQGYNYQEILKHYYTGIEIVQRSPAATVAPEQ